MRIRKTLAMIASIAVLGGAGAAISAQPALADGTNGEIRGFLWPGSVGNNWEGTYRIPGGEEGWCASIWAPEPIHAGGYVDGGTLTYNDGTPLEADKLQKLAYIVSEASDKVINQGQGQQADSYAAAVSVIVHSWTNSNPSSYDPTWPLSAFQAGQDPLNTGQQPQQVPGIYSQLIEDANLYYGPWNLTLTANTQNVAVGDTVTITGQLKTQSGTSIPSKDITLDITGASGPASVTTDATGAFAFDVTVTSDTASVTAHRFAPADTVTMKVPVPDTWNGTKPQNMIVVSDNEVSQNLAIEASTPQLGTSAADQSDGDRTLDARGGTIVDTVTYTGLTPGVEYTIKGELVTPEGTPLNITGETTFTPTTTNGTVTVTFTVPAGHDGTSLVAFERAYDAQGLVATHEDPTDPAQTITVSPKEKAKKSSLAATGLDSDLLPLAGLLAMAGATAFISRRKLMRK